MDVDRGASRSRSCELRLRLPHPMVVDGRDKADGRDTMEQAADVDEEEDEYKKERQTVTLWEEYENNSSLEANLVKDFDKVEMILQALEYESEHGKVLDEFFLSTAGKFQTETGKSWAAEVVSRRSAALGNKLN